MEISQTFKKLVSDNSITRVRLILKDSLLLDPTFAQFDEMQKYASKYMTTLYDIHNGEIFTEDINEWTEKYLNKQMVILINNFSKERIDFIKKIIAYLYKDLNQAKTTADSNESDTKKLLGLGVMASGVVISATGLFLLKTPMLIGGGVILVGGIAISYLNREE